MQLVNAIAGRRRARPGDLNQRRGISVAAYALIFGAIAFLVIYPALTLLMTSFEADPFSPQMTLSLGNWIAALSQPRWTAAIVNTVTLGVTREAIALSIGVPLAWLIARTNLPGAGWLEFGFWVALFMPALPVTLSWVLLADQNIGVLNLLFQRITGSETAPFNIYSWWGIVWVHLMTSTLAVKVFLLVPAFRAMDAALEDAARLCGASIPRMLRQVVVPLMLPTITVVMLFGLIRSLQAFEIELILGYPAKIDVFSTAIYWAINSQPPGYGIASVLAVIFLGAIAPLVVLQQSLGAKRSHVTIAGKFSTRLQDLGRWRWWLFAAIGLLLCFMTILPFALLLAGSFMKQFGMFDLPQPWTFRNWQEAFGHSDIALAFWNSIRLAVFASATGMILYSLLAYLIVKTRFRFRRALDFLTWLPAVIPGLVLGLGYLQMFSGTPLFRPIYGTMAVLVIAVVIGTLSLGTQIVKTSLLRLGSELEEAALTAGATPFGSFRRIILPLIAPAIAVVGLEVFATGMAVVGLVALLATGATQPLAILQLAYLDNGLFEPAAVIGIVIMALTVSAALLARHLGLKVGIGRPGV
ncbi:MAG TPA: iron ABC transporter permease [Stellaceae bacterium]|nr:iron ABC transporter permease [Stellaceae bacterium]